MILKHSLIILFICYSFLGISQTDGYLIKVAYQPNNTYIYKIKSGVSTDIKKQFDEEMKNISDSLGSPLKLKSWKKESVRMTVSTSSKNHVDGNLPVEVLFDEFSYKGQRGEERLKDDREYKSLKMVGKINAHNEFEVDEVYIDNKRSEEEHKIRELYRNFGSLLLFPNDRLKIRESFTIEKPMLDFKGNDDVFGNTAKTKLRLTKVKKQIAYFSLEELMDIKKENLSEDILNLKMSALGEVEVDISKNCVKNVIINRDVSYDEVLFENNKVNYKIKSFTEVDLIDP